MTFRKARTTDITATHRIVVDGKSKGKGIAAKMISNVRLTCTNLKDRISLIDFEYRSCKRSIPIKV